MTARKVRIGIEAQSICLTEKRTGLAESLFQQKSLRCNIVAAITEETIRQEVTKWHQIWKRDSIRN